MNEWWGIVLSFVYIFFIILLAEFIRRIAKFRTSITREIVHIGVSLWGIGIYFLFRTWWGVLVPPLVFSGINYLSYRYEIFKAMELKGNIGTILYPLSLCIIFPFFWYIGNKIPAVAGLLVMGFGDGFAGIVGQKFGKHRYKIFNAEKSIEGSIAMFLFSFLAVFLIFLIFSPSFTWAKIISISLITALASTLVEAISIKNFDNLTVPIIASLIIYLMMK